MSKIVINKNKCIGCFKCVRSCPSIFKVDDDGKAGIISGNDKYGDMVQSMIINCPVGAINIAQENEISSLFWDILNK